MVGIILIAHGRLAEEILDCVQRMVGKKDKVWAINILPHEGINHIQKRLQEILKKGNLPDGFVVVVDMFGGTPCNACSQLVKDDTVSIISGLNLPIVTVLLNYRENLSRQELVEKAITAGKDSILDVKEKLTRATRNQTASGGTETRL